MKSRFRRPASFLFCCSLFLMVTYAGCDWLAEQAGLDQVEINTSGFAGNIPVAPNVSHASSGNVNRGGVTLPRVFEVTNISIEREDVNFTPASGKTEEVQANCTLTFAQIVERYPAITGTIQIANNAVTSVTTTAVGEIAAAEAIIESLPEDERPELAADYETRSPAEIRQIVNDALRSTQFSTAIIVQNQGECAGLLSINRMTFHLSY